MTLLMIAHGEPIPERINTPELIRLSGAVGPGSAAGGLIVQYGYGERVAAIERLQRNYERYSTLRGSNNTFFGIELPKTPLFWANATVEPDGRFITDWFPAIDDPVIVVHNAERAIGNRDFTLPRTFATGQTFTVEPVALTPTKALALDYQATEQPVSVQARLTLINAQIAPEDRSSVARLLSVLDYIDPRLFVFAAGLGPYKIEPGATVIAGLPAFGQMQVRVKGALTAHAIDRTLSFTGDRANLAISSADLVPGNEKAQFKGLVVLEHSYLPVKDAKVVFRCAENIETTTNDDGEFGIPGACAGRAITFFVTARDWMQPARFQSVQLRKTIQPKSGAEPLIIAIPVPEPPPRTPKPGTKPEPELEDRPSPGEHETARLVPLMSSPAAPAFRGRAVPPDASLLSDSQYDDGPIVYVSTPGLGKDRVDNVVNAEWEDIIRGIVKITVSTSATWKVLLATSAFVVYTNDAVEFTKNVPKVVETTELPGMRYGSYLSIINVYGWPASNIPAYFSSPAVDPDPTEVDTNIQGVANMGTLDTDTVHVFVSNADNGYYDCDVKLDFRRDANVFLLKSPNDSCPKR